MKWAMVVNGWVYRVLGDQGVDLQGPRGSRGLQVLTGSRGRPKGSLVVNGWAHWVPGGQGVGLQGHRKSRGTPTGS